MLLAMALGAAAAAESPASWHYDLRLGADAALGNLQQLRRRSVRAQR